MFIVWKKSRFADYALYITLFYLLGGLVVDHSFLSKAQLPEGEYTYSGCVKEVKQGKEWSRVHVQVNGFWDAFSTRWNAKVKGEKVILMVKNDRLPEVQPWQKVLFSASFTSVENKGNAGEFNVRNYYLSQGVRYSAFLSSDTVVVVNQAVQKGVGYYLNKIATWGATVLETYVGEEEAPVVRGMLLGDQSAINWEIKAAFINTGSSHMLAVSGAHIAVITAVLIGLISQLGFNPRGIGASVFLFIFLWAYALLTGASPSVIRSVLMFSLFIIVRFSYRPANNIQILSLSALIIVAINWNSALDVGFQLSYAAMLGIFLVYPRLHILYEPKKKWLKFLWDGSVLCIAAQVFTTPLALYHFHQFPNYFLISNFLVLMASTPMLVGGMLLLVVSPIGFLAKGVGFVLKWITLLFVEGLKLIDHLPAAVAFGYDLAVWVLVLSMGLILWIIIGRYTWRKSIGIAMILILLSFQRILNYFKSGVYVFNHDGIAYVIKQGNKAVFFCSPSYDSGKIGERLMKDFVRVYPCEYQLRLLPQGKEEVLLNDFGRIEAEETFYKMELKGEEFYFVKNPTAFNHENLINNQAHIVTFERVKTVLNSTSSGRQGFWVKRKREV